MYTILKVRTSRHGEWVRVLVNDDIIRIGDFYVETFLDNILPGDVWDLFRCTNKIRVDSRVKVYKVIMFLPYA